MLRYIFLLFCSIVTIITCGLTTNLIQLLLYFTVKPFRSDFYYRINYYLCYTYFSFIVFLADWYCNADYHSYVNSKDIKYFGKEHTYAICNHPGGLDWIINVVVAEKLNLLGNMKLYVKNTIQYIPGVGLNLNLSDHIFLTRNYNKDKEIIADKIRTLMNYPSYITLTLTPEGTRFTKEKHKISMQFAKEKGLPVLKHHLTPRTKGFLMSLPIMREKFNAVYDVTVAFKSNHEYMDLLHGKQIHFYLYTKRIPIEEIPLDEKEASTFLHELFVEKDKLIDRFYKTGDFDDLLKEKGVFKYKVKKSYLSLVNAVAWFIFSVGLVCFGPIYLLLSGYTFLLKFLMAFYTILLAVAYLGCYLILNIKSTYGLTNSNNQKNEIPEEKK